MTTTTEPTKPTEPARPLTAWEQTKLATEIEQTGQTRLWVTSNR